MRKTCLFAAGLCYALAALLFFFIHAVGAAAAPASARLALSLLLSAGSLAGLGSTIAGTVAAHRDRKAAQVRLDAMQAGHGALQ